MKRHFFTLLLGAGFLVQPGQAQSKLDTFYRPLNDPQTRLIEYTVKPGDSLGSIAQKLLGNAEHHRLIAEVNHLGDGRSPEPGSIVKVPVPRMAILYAIEKNEGCDLYEVGSEHVFRAGERFRLRLTTNIEGYLYVFNRKPNGNVERINPESMNQKVVPFADSILPNRGKQWYRMDNERGNEELIVLVSLAPLTELESDLAAEKARQRIRRLLNENAGEGILGEAQDGIGRSLVLANPTDGGLVLAHRIVIRKR